MKYFGVLVITDESLYFHLWNIYGDMTSTSVVIEYTAHITCFHIFLLLLVMNASPIRHIVH